MRRVVRVQWSDPILIDEAIKDEITLNKGLYYITNLYQEKETSEYLGMASNTIRSRLIDHAKHWLSEYDGEVYVRCGIITYPKNVDYNLIYDVESALIYTNRELFNENTAKLKSYSYLKLYRVENMGNYFELDKIADMYEHPDY